MPAEELLRPMTLHTHRADYCNIVTGVNTPVTVFPNSADAKIEPLEVNLWTS